jgi:hypothetical protein
MLKSKHTGGNRMLRREVAIFMHDRHKLVISIAYYITGELV